MLRSLSLLLFWPPGASGSRIARHLGVNGNPLQANGDLTATLLVGQTGADAESPEKAIPSQPAATNDSAPPHLAWRKFVRKKSGFFGYSIALGGEIAQDVSKTPLGDGVPLYSVRDHNDWWAQVWTDARAAKLHCACANLGDQRTCQVYAEDTSARQPERAERSQLFLSVLEAAPNDNARTHRAFAAGCEPAFGIYSSLVGRAFTLADGQEEASALELGPFAWADITDAMELPVFFVRDRPDMRAKLEESRSDAEGSCGCWQAAAAEGSVNLPSCHVGEADNGLSMSVLVRGDAEQAAPAPSTGDLCAAASIGTGDLGGKVARTLLVLLKHHLYLVDTPRILLQDGHLRMDVGDIDAWWCGSEQSEERAVAMVAQIYDWMFDGLRTACPVHGNVESPAWTARSDFCHEFKQECRWFRWGISSTMCAYVERRLCFAVE